MSRITEFDPILETEFRRLLDLYISNGYSLYDMIQLARAQLRQVKRAPATKNIILQRIVYLYIIMRARECIEENEK